jgi:hypothetical protein
MTIIDPDTCTMTPHAQMWFGLVMALFSLFIGIMTLRTPMDTLGRILVCFWFVNVLSMAWTAWRGYQRRPKSGASAK